jgi:RHS repeat-associated protein
MSNSTVTRYSRFFITRFFTLGALPERPACRTARIPPLLSFFVSVFVLSVVLSFPTFAQNYPYATGFPPFSTQVGGPYDVVNLANSSISVSLPLRTKTGPIAFSSVIFGASNAYQIIANPSAPYWQMTLPSFQPLTNVGATIDDYPTETTCKGQVDWYYSDFAVADAFGTRHPLSPTLVLDSGGCLPLPSGPQSTTDGSGYTVVFTGVVTYQMYDRHGNTFPPIGSTTGMTTPDGITLLDTYNGNAQTITDSLTATPVLTTNPTNGTGSSSTYNYTDAAGHTQTYTVNYSGYTQATNFACNGVFEGPTRGYLPTEIVTPEGNYTIAYETTPNYSSTKFAPPYWTGRISEITLPSGGSISYTYSGGNEGINCTSWVVPTLTRTLNDGAGNSSTWTYVNSNTSGTLGSPDGYANFTVAETDPAGNQTVHYFQGQYQTQTMTYEGGCPTTISGCTGGGTLLRTVTTCFNGNFSNCSAPTTLIAMPFSQTDVYTSTNGSSSNLVETKYDTVHGNIIEIKQYDFGASMPPTGSPISDTVVSYGQSWNGTSCSAYATGTYIFDTPCYSHTMNSSGVDVAKTQITYSSTGHPTSTMQWVSGSTWLTTSATYNSNGTVATAHDVNGALSTYSYNGTTSCNGFLPTSVTVTGSGLPSGGLTTSDTWDCNGAVQTASTDANGQTTTTNYKLGTVGDPFYRPVSVVDPLGNSTTYTYEPTSFESAMTFGTSTTDVLTTTDGLRRLSLSQTRQGPSSSTFDSTQTAYGWTSGAGPFTTVSVPYSGTAGQIEGVRTSRAKTQYDALHRPVSLVDSLYAFHGYATYTYVKNDVLQAFGPAPTGENLKQRQFEYDGLGRLTSVCEITSAAGSGAGSCGQSNSETGLLTKYVYDALGNVLTVTQNAQPGAIGGQQTRTYTYDGLSRLLSETNPESGTQHYTYDAACGTFSASTGDLTKSVDALNNTVCLGYDALHRLSGAAYPSGPYAASTAPKTYVYDVTTFSCPGGAYVKGRLAEAYTGTSTSKTTDLGFCYSPRGEVTDTFQESGLSGGYYHAVQSYYANGAAKQLSGIPGLATFTYALDGEGRPNSVSASSGQNPVTSMNYNTFGTPNSVIFGSGDSDTFVVDGLTGRMTQFNFAVGAQTFTGKLGWNSLGTLGQLAITDPIDSSDSQTCNYTHDDLSRVASVNCGTAGAQNYTYDAFGNITKTGSLGTFQPTYSSSTNRMATLNGVTVQYDANGNLLNDGVNSYTWNADGSPTKLNSTTWTLDAFGRQVERSLGSGFQQTLYIPTGDKFAFMTGQVLSRAWLPLPGGGTAVYDYSVNNALYFYRHPDWLGSSRVTSTPSRAFSQTVAYLPFGENYLLDGTTDLDFTGQNSNNVTGLYDFPAREYSAIQGRWISPDPAGLGAVDSSDPQTWNRYAYVRNSPLDTTDPLGLDGNGPDPCPDDFCINPPSVPGLPPNPNGFLPDTNPTIDWQNIIFGPLDPSLVIFNFNLCYNSRLKLVPCTDPSSIGNCDDLTQPDRLAASQCPTNNGTINPYYEIARQLAPLKKLDDCAAEAVINQSPVPNRLFGIPKGPPDHVDQALSTAEKLSENKWPARVVWGLNMVGLPTLSEVAENALTKVVATLSPYAGKLSVAGWAWAVKQGVQDTSRCYNKPD